MKKTLQNKVWVSLICFLMLSIPQMTNGDDNNWIEEQIEQYVQNEIEQYIKGQIENFLGISAFRNIANSTNSFLGPIGSWLWESVVSSSTQSSLEESARKFENYIPSKTELNALNYKYPKDKLWNNYSDIYNTQKTFVNNMLFSIHDVRIKDLAKGTPCRLQDIIIDSLNEKQNLVSPNFMTDSVVNYVDAYQQIHPEMKDTLLADIVSNINLGFIINNHPETLDVYANCFNIPSLRNNPKHLLHWGVNANSHVSFLPKKSKLIDARKIEFHVEDGKIQMKLDNKTLGTTNVKEKTIVCDDIELLNLMPYPNTTYFFNGIEYNTDVLGRVIKVTQTLNENNKMKCVFKSKLKTKKANKYLGNDEVKAYYPLALFAYQAPEALINTAFYIENIENKTTIKNIQKAIKVNTKPKNYNIKLVSELEYNDGTKIPSTITVYVNNQKFVINNPSANLTPLSSIDHTYADYFNEINISDMKISKPVILFGESVKEKTYDTVPSITVKISNNSQINSNEVDYNQYNGANSWE